MKSQVELEKEIKSLQKQTRAADAAFRDCNRRISVLARDTLDIKKRLNKFEPHLVEHYFNSIEEETKHLHERLQLMIHKVTVCTELTWAARMKGTWSMSSALIPAMMQAFDKPDDWWKARSDLTIGEWIEALLDLLEERKTA